MSAFDPAMFPLVEMQAVANAQNVWGGVVMRIRPADGDLAAALESMFSTPDAFAALAPLDCILVLPDLQALNDAVLAALPPGRTVFLLPAALLDDASVAEHCARLRAGGYRFLFDGAQGAATVPAALGAMALDGALPLPGPAQLANGGEHLAYNADSEACRHRCAAAGVHWFSGQYPHHPDPEASRGDGTSRKRLLALLGMIARDAHSRELELQLKQDPALAHHLLKLVNAAAFAPSKPVTTFSQAIDLLGRRQLQRWLQLLLYARQSDEGVAHPLLSVAAVRAAHMESLCRQQGGDREQQDMAFMVGVFSLLDALLSLPMATIVAALGVPADVANALLGRRGRLGMLLKLVEARTLDVDTLFRGESDPYAWWSSLLLAHQWAIDVNRNL